MKYSLLEIIIQILFYLPTFYSLDHKLQETNIFLGLITYF